MLMVGVAKCPLYEVICYCAGSNGTEISVRYTDPSSGVSTVEGVKCIEVYEDMVRTFRNVRYNISVQGFR